MMTLATSLERRLQIVIIVCVVQAVSVAATPFCPRFDCAKNCDFDLYPKDFQPQDCVKCRCPEFVGSAEVDDGTDKSTQLRLNALESSVSELKAMTGVLLGVVLLLLLAVIILFVHFINKSVFKFKLPKFFGNKDCNVTQKHPPSNCNGVIGNTISTISRIAEHQSNSPNMRRLSTSTPTPGMTDLEPEPRTFRVRQPSESTCPEEGNDISPQGYDNLALSTSTIDTSTLHNTSTSSTSTLGPALSTNTLHTTLPSENHLISNGHANTRV